MSRRYLTLGLIAATVLALLLVPAPEPAQAVPTPCDVPLVNRGCEVVGDAVTGVAGAAAGAAGNAVLGTLAGWVGDGAAWLLRQVAEAIDTTTDVDLGARWFAEHYAFMFGVGAILLLPLLLLTVLQALVRQDLALLARAPFLYLPAAMLLAGLAVSVIQTALAVTDALSAELTAGIADDTGSLAEGITKLGAPGAGVPLFAAFVMALFMALAAAFVWFELILRAAVVYVAVMFMPLFLAAMIWPATSSWIRRLVQVLVAAVLSKLVIVATLSLGLAAFSSGDSPSAVFAGAGMFLLAAFSPFVLFSLIPLVSEAAQPQRESRQALAASTGTALAWNVARTRLSFGWAGSRGRARCPQGPRAHGGSGAEAVPRCRRSFRRTRASTAVARPAPRLPRPRRRLRASRRRAPRPPPRRAGARAPHRPCPRPRGGTGMAHEPSRYRFGPLEPGGALGGLSWGQLATAASGLAALVVSLHAAPGPVGALTGLVLAAAALVAAFSRVGGRPPIAWLAGAGAFATRRVRGAHRHRSRAPTSGAQASDPSDVGYPETLRGVRILSIPTAGGEVGVLRDGASWTAALAIGGGSFALLEPADKERRLAHWGAVLSGLARPGSPVSRVQWLERTVAQPVDELGRYLRDSIAVPPTHASVRSYLELLDDAAPAARQHETFVCLQVDARRGGRATRQAGGGDEGACAVVLRELGTLSERLLQAEVPVRGALSPRLLARAIRLGFDPDARPGLDRRGAGDAERAGVAPANAGPMAAEEGWRRYRSDAAHHATYWIAEWPRVDVGADFLLPFLLDATVRRAMSVVIEPLDPARAMRAAENARTNEASDDELRARLGFLATARRRRQQEALAGREEEIADGHAACRFSGYVTVSAGSEDELEAACAEVEQMAQSSRLELRPLLGDQAVGFTYTLPLCRGLR